MTQLYYIEDDENIAADVKTYLEQRGYQVTALSTLKAAKKAMEQKIPDLALIDWNMPDGKGDTLCRWMKSKWKDIPVIFLTVRNDTRDIVAGFDNGADDYIVKPFELEVLHSRIMALLRRTGKVSEQYLTCGEIAIDQNRMLVLCHKQEVSVSQAEYQLLLLLLQNKGKTITREKLLEHIWDNNGNFVNDNTLTVTMKRLREKLGQPACLKTIRSFGYRMEENE